MIRYEVKSDEDRVIKADNIMCAIKTGENDDDIEIKSMCTGELEDADLFLMVQTLMVDTIHQYTDKMLKEANSKKDLLAKAMLIFDMTADKIVECAKEDFIDRFVQKTANNIIRKHDNIEDIMKELGNISNNAEIVAIDLKAMMENNKAKEEEEEGNG